MEVQDDEALKIFTNCSKQIAQIDLIILETKNLMKPMQDKIKQLKIEREELEKELFPCMKTFNLDLIELPDKGLIEYKVKQAVIPVTQKTIKERMIHFFREGPGSQIGFNSLFFYEKGEEMFNYIYAKKNRQFIEKKQLKTKNLKF